MLKLKRLPNYLSSLRVVLCIPLFFIKPLTTLSMVIYIIAGTTDIFDGPLARRIKDAKTELGAVLDSVADLLLVVVGIFFILPKMETFSWMFLAYAIAFGYKVLSAFSGYFKHKETVLLHTYSNKALGVILWVTPILYWVIGPCLIMNIYLITALCCIFIITTEEILINLLLLEPSRNIKSIFGVKKENNLILERRKNSN